jgi:hypothetical protein
VVQRRHDIYRARAVAGVGTSSRRGRLAMMDKTRRPHDPLPIRDESTAAVV